MPISRNSSLFPFSAANRTPENALMVKELEQIVEYFRREVDIAFEQLAVVQDGINPATQTALNLKANIASPNLTGVPTAPTAEPDTDTSQIATTEYVIAQGYLKAADAVTLYDPLGSAAAALVAANSYTDLITDPIDLLLGDLVTEFNALVTSLNPIATSGSYGDLSGVPAKLVNLAAGTVGTSLAFTGDTLNTIQGIRTTDTPQFAGLSIGTSSTVAKLTIAPGTVSATSIGGRNINLGAHLLSSSGRSGFSVELANNFTSVGDNAGFYWLYPYDTGGAAGYKVFRASAGASLVDVFYVQQNGLGCFAGNLLVGTTSETGLTGVGGLKIASTTGSSSPTTGALVVSGGIGVGGVSFFGNNIFLDRDTQFPSFTITGANNSSVLGVYDFKVSSGTIAAATAAKVNDGCLIRLNAHDGSVYSTIASIQLLAAEAQTGSAKGSYMIFSTVIVGATTNSQRMRISGAGNLLIGTTSDTGLTGAGNLKVNSSALLIGNLDVGYAISTGTATIDVGRDRTGSGESRLDLIGDTVHTDYGLRIARQTGGENANSVILHRGSGGLNLFNVHAGAIIFSTNAAERSRITSAGNLLVGTTSETGLTGAGNTRTSGAFLSGNPSGGTAATFKVGVAASVSPTAPNTTIQLEIAGTTYFVHAKTTND